MLKDKASIDSILKEMTLEEKLLLLTGGTMFYTRDFEKYGIPRTCYLDGGTGFNTMQMTLETAITALNRVQGLPDAEQQDDVMGTRTREAIHMLQDLRINGATSPELLEFAKVLKEEGAKHLPNPDIVGCYPPGMLLGATWNTDAVRDCGEAVGREACALGIDVLLGSPNVNIHRDPRNGRLFEGYSEDPYLVSALAPSFVKGVQASGVAANVKHFAANNHETERMGVNEIISDRALYELYLPGFRACVQEGGCKTVMSAYNKINGIACAENHWLLEEVLRDEWGFNGLVVSDWGAVYDRVEGLKNGNDLTMPGPRKIGMLIEAVNSGVLPMETVDNSVRRTLELTLELPAVTGRRHTDVDQTYSFGIAYRAAVEGITLLKNDGILPFSSGTTLSFYGERSKTLVASGVGSASVTTNRVTELFCEAERRLGSDKVWFGKVPAEADVVVVTVGANGQEGSDRPDMKMEPEDEETLTRAIADAKQADKPVVLVLNTSAPVELAEFIDDIAAVLCLYLPGMAGGKAGIDILFGDVEPGGRLPLSWPRYYRDTPTAINFPCENGEVMYGEGLFVGYRYYDEKQCKTLFPFGYGLSYTTFELSSLNVPEVFDSNAQETAEVSVCIKNTGNRKGTSVVQLYIRDEVSTLKKPYKELKAFQKVSLMPEEAKTLRFLLDINAFASYDNRMKQWVSEPGAYQILVGTSSEDTPLSAPLNLLANVEFGLSADTRIADIVSSPEAMRILKEHIPDIEEHVPLRTLTIFMANTRFGDIWKQYANFFENVEEKNAAFERILTSFSEV